MSSEEKNQERTVVMPLPHTEKDVFTVTALREALDQLAISEYQTELILEKLCVPSSSSLAVAAVVAATPAASVVVAPSSVAVAATSGTRAAATATAAVKTTHGSDDLMDDEVEDTYGDDDDGDDDSGYDGNVQYPYHPQPQSKIQYDSDEDSVEDYEFSQQVNYN